MYRMAWLWRGVAWHDRSALGMGAAQPTGTESISNKKERAPTAREHSAQQILAWPLQRFLAPLDTRRRRQKPNKAGQTLENTIKGDPQGRFPNQNNQKRRAISTANNKRDRSRTKSSQRDEHVNTL